METQTLSSSSSITPSPLFTRNFGLMSFATLFFFASNHVLTPSFPLYLSQNGSFDPQWFGWVLSSFMFASLTLRPFVGQWCDRYGSYPWMIMGASLFALCPLLYYVLPSHSPIVLLLVRMLHGIGLALFYTASNVALSLEVPQSRRAEGMSHYSNAIKMAMAFGPALGLFFASQKQFTAVFSVAAGFSLLSLLLIGFVDRKGKAFHSTLGGEGMASGDERKTSLHQLIQRDALFPGLIMASNSVIFGTLIPFAPFLATEKGMPQNIGLFYTVYALCLILSRGVTGPLSDQLSRGKSGRGAVILPGMLGVCLSMLVLFCAADVWTFMAAVGFYGLCAGTVQPSLMALVADRVPASERGAGMATFTLCTDLGIALGTLVTGSLAPLFGYNNILLVMMAVTATGSLAFLSLEPVQQRSIH